METEGSGSLQEDGAEALQLMEKALELLDRCADAPGEIGAQLDHAIHRLRGAMGSQPMAPDTMESRPGHP